MAITYVGGTSGAGTGASYTISLSGTLTGGSNTSPSPGDIVIVFVGESNGGTVTSTLAGNNSGSYTTIVTHGVTADTWDANLDTFRMIQGSTVDTQLTVTRGANNTTYGNAATVQVWRGVDTSNPFAATTTVAGAANSCVINPPAINPTGVTGAIIIAGGCGTMAATSNDFTGFTGMSNFITRKGDGSTSDCGVAMASYAYAGVSYDPPSVSGGTTSTSSAWRGVTLALRPYVPPAQSLTQDSTFSNTQTFHGPTVTAGAVTLSPTLYTNEQTFYSAEVTQTGGAQTLEPTLYNNAQSFFGPAVTSSITLTASLYSNTQTFHAPTVTPGAVTLAPTLYSNTSTIYAPVVSSAGVVLAPELVTNTQTFFGPTITVGPVTLQPTRLDNAQTFYAPSVAVGSVTLSPSLLTNEQTWFAPTLTASYTLLPSLLTNEQTFYASSVFSAYSLYPALTTNSQNFYPATVTPGAVSLTPSLVENSQTFYEAVVTKAGEPVTLLPELFSNEQTFYGATVASGALSITFKDWVEPGHVDPGWVGWPYWNVNQFFSPTVGTAQLSLEERIAQSVLAALMAQATDANVVEVNDVLLTGDGQPSTPWGPTIGNYGYSFTPSAETAPYVNAIMSALAAQRIPINVKQVNDIPLQGNGQPTTPWGPAV